MPIRNTWRSGDYLASIGKPTPCIPTLNGADHALPDAILGTDFSLKPFVGSYGPDDLWRQFFGRTAFKHHIRHVVSLCPEKQMIGVNTKSIITAMADSEAGWNGALKNLVGSPVRDCGTILPSERGVESSLAPRLMNDRPQPIPAAIFIWIGDLFKKARYVEKMFKPLRNLVNILSRSRIAFLCPTHLLALIMSVDNVAEEAN